MEAAESDIGMKRKIPNSKPVVMEIDGAVVGRFDCISDAARRFGHRTSTITNRIERRAVVDGVLLRYPEKGEDIGSFTSLSPQREQNCISRAEGRTQKPAPKPGRKPKPSRSGGDDVELDAEKYVIVPYEVVNRRVCITRCRIKEAPQPLVGSAGCMKCPSFRGRNKKTHQVACSHALRKQIRGAWTKK